MTRSNALREKDSLTTSHLDNSPSAIAPAVEHLVSKHRLTPAGYAYVSRVLISPPSRAVSSTAGNYIGRFASRKNRQSLGPESLLEYCYCIQAEHDSRIVRFCDQPDPIRLRKSDGIKSNVKAYTTPDVLEIASDEIALVECKWEKDLVVLSREFPDQYRRDENAVWHYIPGERAAADLGLRYKIFTEQSCSRTLLNNLCTLRPYHRKNALTIPAHVLNAITSYVLKHKLVTLGALLALPGCRVSYVLRLVATGHLYVDLEKQYLLSGPSLLIALDLETFRALASVVVEADPSEPELIDDFIASLESDPTRFVGGALKQEKEKMRRLRLITPYLDSGRYPPQSPRSLRRYYDYYKRGGLEALKPKPRSGNTTPRMPSSVYPLMQQALDVEYANPNRKAFQRAYEYLGDLCDAKHLATPARKTFELYVRRNLTLEDLTERLGERATYNLKAYKNDQEDLLRRHGSRIFEIAHIDHTEVDVMLVDSETRRLLKKAWLTVMFDAYSRRVLAVWVSFDKPSHVACMMVLRECVRRFKRLPDRIVVDNGKEFHGIYFETLLARYGRDKINRPPHESRVSSVGERFFLTLDYGVNHVMDGNTQALKSPRSMSRSVDPRRRARHTLQDLDAAIKTFAYEIYDKVVHSELQISPRRAYVNSARETGILDLEGIPFDLSFYISTLPNPRGKKTRRVDSRCGIEIDGYDYWSPLFAARRLNGKEVEVRCEPMDIRVVFAFIEGRWHVCRNHQLTGDVRLTRRSVRYLGREVRAKNRLVASRDAINRRRTYRKFHKQISTGRDASDDLKRCRENYKIAQPFFGIGDVTVAPGVKSNPRSNIPSFDVRNRKHFRVVEHNDKIA